MTREQILYTIIEIVERELETDIAVLPTDSAETRSDWDSLVHLRIVLTVEAYYSIRFPTAVIPALASVDALVEAVEKHSNL